MLKNNDPFKRFGPYLNCSRQCQIGSWVLEKRMHDFKNKGSICVSLRACPVLQKKALIEKTVVTTGWVVRGTSCTASVFISAVNLMLRCQVLYNTSLTWTHFPWSVEEQTSF